jgi:hypothetical protein
MVGIPMDGVGAGRDGMWLLLYRDYPASGGVWCVVHFSRLLSPTSPWGGCVRSTRSTLFGWCVGFSTVLEPLSIPQ